MFMQSEWNESVFGPLRKGLIIVNHHRYYACLLYTFRFGVCIGPRTTTYHCHTVSIAQLSILALLSIPAVGLLSLVLLSL